ncbi:hypothetical protein [Corallococcus sp. Z5C101001]|uniref:hypothetical protein n=1 Tax=Corallococcus sp. Z5C101001 TaxID=2596829 RepID=UPI0011804B9C|nr:hypothetical protein [Corallococcus sp. Z5C101001]TSC22610.1 hypothetical protein FOF48_33430 [Corallococcus sp. Z5C101001]
MMRAGHRRGHVLGALLLGGAVGGAGTGCKRDAPAASTPLDAGVAAVAVPDAGRQDAGVVEKVAKPLRFSDVALTRSGDDVAVTYTLTNPGTAQGRGDACLSLHDEHGRGIDAVKLGSITVKGETTDTFEDRVRVSRGFWTQARSLLLYTTSAYSCSAGILKPTSEVSRLLPSGQPAPAGTPAFQAPEDATAADFAVSNIRVRQDSEAGEYLITYTVKNLTARRVSGAGCLRAYLTEGGRGVEEDRVGDFSLPPGGSETITDSILFDDERHWDEVQVLRLFTGPYGCATDVSEDNAGTAFNKPADVHAPPLNEDGPERDSIEFNGIPSEEPASDEEALAPTEDEPEAEPQDEPTY